jgi:hypothetical protein
MFLKDMNPLKEEYWDNALKINRERVIAERSEETRQWFRGQERMIMHNMDMRLVFSRAHYFKLLAKNAKDYTLGLLTISLIRYKHSMNELQIRFAKRKEDAVYMLQETREARKAAFEKDLRINIEREDHIYALLMENKESWEYVNTIIGLQAQQAAVVYNKVALVDLGTDQWRTKTPTEIARVNKAVYAKKAG